DAGGVVQQHAQVADAADARVEARRGLAGLQAREAEDALLRLAREPVVEDLFVRASSDARAPRPAALLVHQDDAVLAALVQGPRRGGRPGRTGQGGGYRSGEGRTAPTARWRRVAWTAPGPGPSGSGRWPRKRANRPGHRPSSAPPRCPSAYRSPWTGGWPSAG